LLLTLVAFSVFYARDLADRLFSSEEVIAYQELVKRESQIGPDPLPSSCAGMAKQWQGYVDRFPGSRLVEAAIEKQKSWQASEAAEIRRGFVITLLKAEIQPRSGERGSSAGESWDGGIFEADLLPDVYAQLVMDGTVVSETPVVMNSLHPEWAVKSRKIQASDEKTVKLVLVERDQFGAVALSLLPMLGTGCTSAVGTLAGIKKLSDASADRSNDDLVGEWEGSIRQLLTHELLEFGDCRALVVKVERPERN